MAVLNCWRVNWIYTDASGKFLQQYPEQSADFVANVLPQVAGGDGTQRPDMNDVKTRIANNYPTPTGATIAIRLITSSQIPAIFS